MKDQEFNKKYKHTRQNRSKEVIDLSNLLARSLTVLNEQRIQSSSKVISKMKNQGIRRQDYLYVCLPGIPPFDEQFNSLQLPGQILVVPFESFQKGLNESEIKQRSKYGAWEVQAKNLYQKIKAASTSKPLVFVFHSFGTYLASAYHHIYGSERILGWIDIGGAPITMYPLIASYIKQVHNICLHDYQQRIEQQFNNLMKALRQSGANPYNNKYQLMTTFTSVKEGIGFANMFQFNRNWPNVLKCIIYGRKDLFFYQSLQNQKAIYYAYQKKLDSEYEKKFLSHYEENYGQIINNIQQKFIFNIEEGFHSVHMQRRYREKIRKIVQNYLQFIESTYSLTPSKL